MHIAWETADQSGWAKWKEGVKRGEGWVKTERHCARENDGTHWNRSRGVNLFDASWREINYFCLLRTVFSRFNDSQVSVNDVISILKHV